MRVSKDWKLRRMKSYSLIGMEFQLGRQKKKKLELYDGGD